MKVLVTGGAGFVGSHLCERLARDPRNNVYSLDNYFTGSENNHVKGVSYIKGCTSDIEKLIKFKPDIIYHLGEYSRVEQSFDDIKIVWDSNKIGTFAVLEFVRKSNCKIVYAGSSTKFGNGNIGTNGSPYAWSKSTNTELVKNYGQWFGVSYAITYFYNVYGKNEIDNGKYATLIGIYKESMKLTKPLAIVLPGTQERNFTHVNDIVDGIILVGKYGNGDGYGIGNPETFTIMEVANLFGGTKEFIPERKGNRKSAEVVISKIQELGWRPKYGLEKYIQDIKKNNWVDK